MPLAIAALVITIFVFFQYGIFDINRASSPTPAAPQTGQTPTQQPAGKTDTAAKPAQPAAAPKATGNINDVISALIKDSTDEQALLNEEAADASLVTNDSQTISDFGQSYETEL